MNHRTILKVVLALTIAIPGIQSLESSAWGYSLWCRDHSDGVSEYEINPNWYDTCARTDLDQIAAVRAAANEWNTSGEACFEFLYTGTSSINYVSLFDDHNVVFSRNENGGGAIAATYCNGYSVDHGWDMQFFDQGIPLCIEQRIDIQGVTTHEFGHALGLGHSSVGCGGGCSSVPTMCPSLCSDGLSERTIEDDDKAGIQAIYDFCPNCHDIDLDGYDDDECGGADCDDRNGSVRPCGDEICGNGIDEDCSGGDRVCEGIQESEDNGTHGWATPLGTVGETEVVAQGNLCVTGHTGLTYKGDLDWFSFDLSEPAYDPMVRIEISWTGDKNFDLWLYNQFGSIILEKATSTQNPEVLYYQAEPGQKFKLFVAGYSGDPGDYRLAITQGFCGDEDGDGYQGALCGGSDCNDGDSAINPAAEEDCADGVDNDCDGGVDYLDGECPCFDDDGDGFGSIVCGGRDCADNDPAVHPDADEDCGSVDRDCSGDPFDKDFDGDGYLDLACGGADCDDSTIGVRPGAPEGCDAIDTDCDGFLGEREIDNDGDGLTECDGDCDDTSAVTYPGAPEVCDLRDNNCDGTADEGVCMVIETLALLGLAGLLLDGEAPPPPDDGAGDDSGGGGGGCAVTTGLPTSRALVPSGLIPLILMAFFLFMNRRFRHHTPGKE